MSRERRPRGRSDPVDAEPASGLFRAERDLPVEQGRQVPAATECVHLIRVDAGALGVPASGTSKPARAR
ncbi:hypothetical protein ABZ128_13640 [Streptomyces sp. NPDC006326]|uniref:hypothetical protein n=1 Tax=Streptomyces sp. NPDC006326 TaxID=3156752 RepID=UPI0033BB2DD0